MPVTCIRKVNKSNDPMLQHGVGLTLSYSF